VRFLILYDAPHDPLAFDRHYLEWESDAANVILPRPDRRP
jgi:hypothetical protein